MPCASEVRCDSGAYVSIHLKPFRFFGVHISLVVVSLRCTCSKPHVSPLQMLSIRHVSVVLRTWMWKLQGGRINWPTKLHFHLHGRCVVVRLFGKRATSIYWKKLLVNVLGRLRKPVGAVALVDSYVVRGATSKGRSSSRALSTVLRRVGASCVVLGCILPCLLCLRDGILLMIPPSTRGLWQFGH